MTDFARVVFGLAAMTIGGWLGMRYGVCLETGLGRVVSVSVGVCLVGAPVLVVSELWKAKYQESQKARH